MQTSQDFGLDMASWMMDGELKSVEPKGSTSSPPRHFKRPLSKVFSDYGASSEYPAALLVDTPGTQGNSTAGVNRPGIRLHDTATGAAQVRGRTMWLLVLLTWELAETTLPLSSATPAPFLQCC